MLLGKIQVILGDNAPEDCRAWVYPTPSPVQYITEVREATPYMTVSSIGWVYNAPCRPAHVAALRRALADRPGRLLVKGHNNQGIRYGLNTMSKATVNMRSLLGIDGQYAIFPHLFL